jgi:vitamin B12 transporter
MKPRRGWLYTFRLIRLLIRSLAVTVSRLSRSQHRGPCGSPYSLASIFLLFTFHFPLFTPLAAQSDTALHSIPNYYIDPLQFRVYPDPNPRIPGGRVWQIDSIALASAQMSNLSDLFRELPSVAVKRYSPGGLATPTIRGTGAGHVQTYWEGLPLNSPMLGQNDFAIGGGSLFNQVGLRYGGTSLVEGSGGLGGSINLSNLSLPATTPNYQLSIRTQYASFHNPSGNMELATATGKWTTLTKIYLASARNDFPFRNAGLAGTPVQRLPNAGYLQGGGLQEISRKMGMHTLTARCWGLGSDRHLPPTMITVNAGELQEDHAVRSMLEWKMYRRGATLKTRAAWFRESSVYHNPLAGILAPTLLHRWTLQSDFTPSVKNLQDKFRGTAGFRLLYDQATSQGYTQPVNQFTGTAHAKGETTLAGKHNIVLLLREEWWHDHPSPLMAYLGSQWFLSPYDLCIQASLSRNARNPTLNDLYWVPGGNPELDPERSLGGEASLVYSTYHPAQSSFEYKDQGVHAEVGGYWNRVTDWILWVPVTGAIWQPQNVQQVTAAGAEAIFKRIGYVEKLRYDIQAQYTFSSSRNQDGHQLIYTPQHTGSLSWNLNWKGWNLHYFQDWNSRRYTVMDNSQWIKGFSTADASIGYKGRLYNKLEADPSMLPLGTPYLAPYHRGTWMLQAGVRNLTHAQYQTVAWRPMPGRSIFVRLDITFDGGKKVVERPGKILDLQKQ